MSASNSPAPGAPAEPPAQASAPAHETREPPPWGLVVACAALMGLLALQFALPSDDLPQVPVGVAPRRLRPVTPPPTPETKAILAAPLFAPDRLPGAPTVAGAAAGAPANDTLAGYAALGAVTGRGAASGVVSAPGGKVVTLKVGQVMDQWRLAGVSRTRLSFVRGGVRRDLVVGTPAVAGAGAPPAANTDQ